MIRRNRNVLEMAVATAIFGACALGAVPASHATEAASASDDNDATSQTADQDQKKSKEEVANQNAMQTVVVSGFVSSLPRR